MLRRLEHCSRQPRFDRLPVNDAITGLFTEKDLALQMSIKTVFDPDWLLNASKVFPLDGRPPRREAA